jgi:hypothetical protein
MIVQRHFEALLEKRPGATLAANDDQSHTITVPDLQIPPGWNRDRVAVAFVAPAAYPIAQPDCFWAEPGLALAHGGVPQNTGQNPGPNIGPGWLWFSWHPSNWDANKSDMETYLKIIRRRFAEPR